LTSTIYSHLPCRLHT